LAEEQWNTEGQRLVWLTPVSKFSYSCPWVYAP